MDVETLTLEATMKLAFSAHMEKTRNFVLIIDIDVMRITFGCKEIMYALELGSMSFLFLVTVLLAPK